VGSLLAARGELAAKRRESAAAGAACEKLQKRAAELDAQIKESELQYAEIRSNMKSRESARAELAGVNAELDRRQRELEEVRSRVAEASAELEGLAKRRRDAEAELKKFGELLQKTRAMIKDANMAPRARQGGGADVMRAASSMVAALNSKVRDAEREAAVLRGMLEKERRDHAETRRRLSGQGGDPAP